MIHQRLAKRLLLWVGLCCLCIAGTQTQERIPLQASPPTADITHTGTNTGIPIFGYETNINRINDAAIRSRAQELGGSWIRLNTVSWRDLQPTEDTPVEAWNWDTLKVFEQELLTAQELGLTPLFIADDFPDWAVKPYTIAGTNSELLAPCSALKTDYFDDYSVYLRELIKRYSVAPYHVHYWEIGNEVDVDPRLMSSDLQELFGCWGDIEDPYYGGEHYGNMLKVIAPVIRAADSQAKIVTGGLLLDRAETNIEGRGKPEKFFEGILKAGAASSFDIAAYHAYPWYSWDQGRKEDVDLTDYRWTQWGGVTTGKAKYLRSLMAAYGVDKPLFLNEVALLYWGGSATEEFNQTQGDHIVRSLVRAMSVDVEMFSWYTLHSSGWNSSGLLNSDATPRPSFIAYKVLIEQMKTADDPVSTEVYGSMVESYRFTRQDGNLVDVVWSRDGTTDYIKIPAHDFVEAISRDGKQLTPQSTATRVILPVWVEPVYLVRKAQTITNPPTITAVEPNSLLNANSTVVTLAGESFSSGANVWLEYITPQKTASIQLENVVFKRADQLEVTVPALLPPGTYDIVVQNPSGAMGVLSNGITIEANIPDVVQVLPEQGRVHTATHLLINGDNFMANSEVRLGNWTLPADAITYITPQQLFVTLPATPTLASGQYPLTVINPDTTSDTLENGFWVIAPDEVDVYGYADQLWTEPLMPRIGQPMQIGQMVYRLGTDYANAAVEVTFYRDNTSADNKLGIQTIRLPSQTSTITTPGITWTAAFSGVGKLCTLIDKDDVVPEANENNNRVCRDILVLPRAIDETPPHIQSFTINGEAAATTTNSAVVLAVQATDSISGSLLANGTGIAAVIFQEYFASTGNAQWVPSHHSEWITDTATSTYTWQLLPVPGKKYIQVWVVDTSGNISAPAIASVVFGTSDDGANDTGIDDAPHSKTVPPLTLPSGLLPEGVIIQQVYLPLVSHTGV